MPHGGLLDLAAARTPDLVDGAGERVTAHFAGTGEPGIMVLISPGQSDLTEVAGRCSRKICRRGNRSTSQARPARCAAD